MFTGKTYVEAETPTLWPPDTNNRLIGKDPDTGERLKTRRWQRMRERIDSITNLMHMNLYKLWQAVEDRGTWHAVVHGVAESWTRLSD